MDRCDHLHPRRVAAGGLALIVVVQIMPHALGRTLGVAHAIGHACALVTVARQVEAAVIVRYYS